MNAADPGRELPSLAVLVVDDNEVNRVFMTHLLRNRGHRPVAAADGRETLLALAETPFDIILMDIQLPDTDGLALTRAIRSGQCGTQNPSDIPILALTAFAMQGDRERCLEAGMNDHVSKPIRAPELLAAMARALAGRHNAGTPKDADAPIDLSEFAQAGRREFAQEMLALFLELAEPKGQELDDAVARGDIQTAMVLAHDLAGMTGPLRATRLGEAMRAVQAACQSGDLKACRERQAQAARELADACRAARNHPLLTQG